jgi:hypothetical protein
MCLTRCDRADYGRQDHRDACLDQNNQGGAAAVNKTSLTIPGSSFTAGTEMLCMVRVDLA